MKRLFALAFCLVLLLCSGSAYSESWYENLGYEGDVQVTAGYSRFSTGGKEKADFTWDGIGCGADLQIKFFSAHLFSPVLGLSWSHLSGDEVNVEINGDDEDMDMRSSADEFKFYAGVSLNF